MLKIINKKIVNSKGDVLEMSPELLRKVLLQTKEINLLDDLSWSKSLDECLFILRSKRDSKLRETDYIFLSDTTKIISTDAKSLLKIERQRLRDITENLSTIEEVLQKIKEL